jgi:hypothetical protein
MAKNETPDDKSDQDKTDQRPQMNGIHFAHYGSGEEVFHFLPNIAHGISLKVGGGREERRNFSPA